jgi:hypothetical protein
VALYREILTEPKAAKEHKDRKEDNDSGVLLRQNRAF